MQFFFLAVSFPKKAFVFPNNRISEARICRQCWFKKISQKRKTKQQKKLCGNVFPLSPRSHVKIELIWTRKKFSLKSHLRACCTKPFNFFAHHQSDWACMLYNVMNLFCVWLEWLMDGWVDGQTDWLTGRLTDWLTDWLTGRQTDWLTGRLTDWLTGRLTDWLTDWLADRLTDWSTDWVTDWLTDWLTDQLTEWLTNWLTGGMGRQTD